MTPEEQSGHGSQSPALSHLMDKSDVSSVVEPCPPDLQKNCPGELGWDDRLIYRRKNNARPRLPSFRGLGISSFEPQTGEDSYARKNSHAPSDRIVDQSAYGSPVASSSTQRSLPGTGSAPLLTPPDEHDSLAWTTDSPAGKLPASGRQDACHLPHKSPFAYPSGGTSLAGAGAQAENLSFDPSNHGASESAQDSGNNNTSLSTNPLDTSDSTSWLGRSVGAAVMSIDPSNPSFNTIQIVSQTLPSPAKESARPTAIFTEIVASIQTRFGAGRQPYITITHAVPPRFDLLNLPSSPPSTPNFSAGRDDYFAQSIFAHAAVVPSYHLTNQNPASPAPSSPNPIVPPSSVQISVLERFIPPSSSQESKELFSLNGQSVLIDRLAELSPNKGSMLFVYPTRNGASTFTSKYLSHILDPLLRALVEVHQLSYGLAESLGSMVAVAEMQDFDGLKVKISSLCRRLSHRITSDAQRSNFDLVYASCGEVTIDRMKWTEWYLKQEHARFKRTLEAYWGRGKRLSQMDSASAGTVLRELIDGVDKMTKEEAEQTGPGIELGVFVIRRNLAALPG